MTVEEFVAYIARDVIENIDLTAEARTKLVQTKTKAAMDEGDSDASHVEHPQVDHIKSMGAAEEFDVEEEDLDLDWTCARRAVHPILTSPMFSIW